MPAAERLPLHARIYIAAIILGGLYVVGDSIHSLLVRPIETQWFLLVALTLISGSATVRLPSVPASISISETFVFSAALLYGPSAGTLIVALDGLMASYWIARRRREPYRTLFNMSAPALSAWCSANVFFWLAHIPPLGVEPAALNRILPSLAVFALTYFGLNSWLIAFAISIETRIGPLTVWRDHFVWLSLNYFFGASVAVLLVSYTRQIDIHFVGVIVPLLVVLYFTFKLSMDRVEDAKRHVDKVNGLYLSTIETLAMAIDAKDQITHGHIRRVQRYAVGLARAVGVEDQSLLKAIETAALLHDMGKLAVPEHILNKPGKLTQAEFEKMKLHASVGADILSAIDFPYPVVPIVRHHHESWDGSGYPDGLHGVQIPIGARILSVVDCFDALTSDRPYRPRLGDQEAMCILNERKGSMYDPLVVETFERIHVQLDSNHEIEFEPHSAEKAGLESLPNPIIESEEQVRTGVRAEKHRDEPLGRCPVIQRPDYAKLLRAVSDQVRYHNPLSICVFYRYESTTDEIVASYAEGPSLDIIGTRIPLGQRLSGWVAANRERIVDSDAALDLGWMARTHAPSLKSCLSAPVIVYGDLVGVLSVYSPQSNVVEPDEIFRGISSHTIEILQRDALQEAATIKR